MNAFELLLMEFRNSLSDFSNRDRAADPLKMQFGRSPDTKWLKSCLCIAVRLGAWAVVSVSPACLPESWVLLLAFAVNHFTAFELCENH